MSCIWTTLFETSGIKFVSHLHTHGLKYTYQSSAAGLWSHCAQLCRDLRSGILVAGPGSKFFVQTSCDFILIALFEVHKEEFLEMALILWFAELIFLAVLEIKSEKSSGKPGVAPLSFASALAGGPCARRRPGCRLLCLPLVWTTPRQGGCFLSGCLRSWGCLTFWSACWGLQLFNSKLT